MASVRIARRKREGGVRYRGRPRYRVLSAPRAAHLPGRQSQTHLVKGGKMDEITGLEGLWDKSSVRFLDREMPEPLTGHRVEVLANVPCLVIVLPIEGKPAMKRLAATDEERDEILEYLASREGLAEAYIELAKRAGFEPST